MVSVTRSKLDSLPHRLSALSARIIHLWPPRFAADSEQSAALFRGIRLRLTLWYTGILAAALLVLGIALYVGVRHELLQPIDDSLQSTAQGLGVQWQALPQFGCPSGRDLGIIAAAVNTTDFAACYDQTGFQPLGHFADQIAQLNDPYLARVALRSGSASSIVDIGHPFGRVKLYDLAVPAPTGGALGVIQVGAQIGPQLDALSVLLLLLWIMGVFALLSAGIGGLFLADRALLPARLAYARQRDFIADASHELRTPLTMLRADAEVLLRGRQRLDPDDAAILEDVVAEASHMAALANSMLNLARLDASDMPMERDVVDLAALAGDLGRRAGPLAEDIGVKIRVESDRPALVIGDRLLLDQAALVLVDNAIKYNQPGGEVVITTAIEDGQARLTVGDTGIGIAAEHLPHLGERFYRVDKARSREAGGAGLGVSIARAIAVRHGGSLTLSSNPGHGTTATLSLPAAGA